MVLISLLRTPKGQISEILHLIKNTLNIYYCKIRLVVFICNAGRYHAKFCLSSKTRVSHFRKFLEAPQTSLEFYFDPVRTLVFRKIVTHHTISGVLSCYCTAVISRFSLFYDASQPRVTLQILVKYSCFEGWGFISFRPRPTTKRGNCCQQQVA